MLTKKIEKYKKRKKSPIIIAVEKQLLSMHDFILIF